MKRVTEFVVTRLEKRTHKGATRLSEARSSPLPVIYDMAITSIEKWFVDRTPRAEQAAYLNGTMPLERMRELYRLIFYERRDFRKEPAPPPAPNDDGAGDRSSPNADAPAPADKELEPAA
jgi:hypothetical protein